MSNQDPEIQDDPWLINAFKEFDITPQSNKAEMDWTVTTDFYVFSEFLLRDLRDIQERLEGADSEYLYSTCEHLFNVIDWLTLMVEDAGFPTIATAFEVSFEKEFGDRHILQSIYDACFAKWIAQKSGQQKIGENYYNLLENKLFYRNRFEQWFEVDKATAFDLKPKKKLLEDTTTIAQLNNEYQDTWYDTLIKKWDSKQYQGSLPDNFAQLNDNETTPEAYSDFTVGCINALLKDPVSIAELERWNGGEITDLEDIIKIYALVSDMTTEIRADNNHTLYLLRDCMPFYEVQKTLDILSAQVTSFDQVMIGRKLLSHPKREWGYYGLTLGILYDAHKRHPTDFEDFFNDYSRLLDMFVSLNPGFAEIIANLANYIKGHIQTDKHKIVVFDIGFQGSIALLTKYIIDRHISPVNADGKKDTDLEVGVGAVWSKELFGHRHRGYYFPFLNRVQLLARSNDIYHYKKLNLDKVEVTMGEKDAQRLGAIELAVLVTITRLKQVKSE